MMNRIAELDALNKKMKKDILRLKKRNARLDKVIKAKSLQQELQTVFIMCVLAVIQRNLHKK